MKEISCQIIRDLLPLYEDGAVSTESQELVREHLKDCPACREELRRMRTPVSLPPEDEGELWARFQARRDRQRKKRRIAMGCALSLLAALAAFCLWYTRPRAWAEITGEDAEVLFASLTMADPDWDADTAQEKLGYLHWQIKQNGPRREEAGEQLLQVLERYTFRASLNSLIPRDGISMGWRDDVTAAVTWGEDGTRFFYFGETGKMISHNGWGYDIYHCDPALFDELVEIVRTYGAPEEAMG